MAVPLGRGPGQKYFACLCFFRAPEGVAPPGLKSGASTARKDTQAEAYATKPSAPKGGIEFARLTARLKPSPDTQPTTDSLPYESIPDRVLQPRKKIRPAPRPHYKSG